MGKGLSALLSGEDGDYDFVPEPGSGQRLKTVPVESLHPSPYQPRRLFPVDELEELADSIRQKGVLQPLLVRESAPDRYEIVAGERRWRAAGRAGLAEVPVLVGDFTDRDVAEIALIENVQRHDLTPIEEAEGYNRLMTEFAYTQDQLGNVLGKSRSHISNTLRLLDLPESVQGLLANGYISSGHARTLVTVNNPEKLAEKIVSSGWTVRQVEAWVKRKRETPPPSRTRRTAEVRDLERNLAEVTGMKTRVRMHGPQRGEVTFAFETQEELTELMLRFKVGQQVTGKLAAGRQAVEVSVR